MHFDTLAGFCNNWNSLSKPDKIAFCNDIHGFIIDEFPFLDADLYCWYGFIGMDLLVWIYWYGFIGMDLLVWIYWYGFIGMNLLVWIYWYGFIGMDYSIFMLKNKDA